jgi:hypothetical protein
MPLFNPEAVAPSIFQARLTLTSGTAVTTSDVSAATTIYLAPYRGNHIWLYSGTLWQRFNLSQISLALGTLTADKIYDVFCYSNAGTPTLEFSAAWASDTARTDALTTQDGVVVKSGATTRRYVGSFRTTSTTTTEDSNAKRFVWNQYNQVQKKLKVIDTTDSWTYNSLTVRQANGSTANQVAVITGELGNCAELQLSVTYGSEGLLAYIAIGVNSTTVFSDLPGTCSSAIINQAHAFLRDHSRLGYTYYAWLEMVSIAATTKTFYGDNGGTTPLQSGMVGRHWC